MSKILIVDDDEGILDALTLILDEEGYQVRTSYKAEKIYQIIDKFKPDVILLDILMSGQDGRQICKQIKNNPDTKNISIIMLSAHPGTAEGVRANGADDFLSKPFEVAELISKVQKYI